MTKKNNELLIKNHQSRPTGSAAFPEANVTVSKNSERGKYYGRGCGRSGYAHNSSQEILVHLLKKHRTNNEKDVHANPSKNHENIYFKCNTKGHWSCIYCVPEHLCHLYKASHKGWETNLAEHYDPKDDSTHLDVSDFIDDFKNSFDGGDN